MIEANNMSRYDMTEKYEYIYFRFDSNCIRQIKLIEKAT